jgi:hypothetical protein
MLLDWIVVGRQGRDRLVAACFAPVGDWFVIDSNGFSAGAVMCVGNVTWSDV